MTRLDQQADLIRMTRYYLDRSYYPCPQREEYWAAFRLACEFLHIAPDSGTALDAWERLEERHLRSSGKDRPGDESPGRREDPDSRGGKC